MNGMSAGDLSADFVISWTTGRVLLFSTPRRENDVGVKLSEALNRQMNVEILKTRLKRIDFSFSIQSGKSEEIENCFNSTTQHLLKNQFLHHQDKEVQYLVASCLIQSLNLFVSKSKLALKDSQSRNFESILRFFTEELTSLTGPSVPTMTTNPFLEKLVDMLAKMLNAKVFQNIIGLNVSELPYLLFRPVCKLFEALFNAMRRKDQLLQSLQWYGYEIFEQVFNECPSQGELSADSIFFELIYDVVCHLFWPMNSDAFDLEDFICARAIVMRCQAKPFCAWISLAMELMERDAYHFPEVGVVVQFFAAYDYANVFRLAFELHQIKPNSFESPYNKSKGKIECNEVPERRDAVEGFGSRLCEIRPPGLQLKEDVSDLWSLFIKRVTDSYPDIRLKVLEMICRTPFTSKDWIKDTVKAVLSVENDQDPSVRSQVVKSICRMLTLTTTQEYWNLEPITSDTNIRHTDDSTNPTNPLLECLQRRLLDVDRKVRADALKELENIYMHLELGADDIGFTTKQMKKALPSICNAILHAHKDLSMVSEGNIIEKVLALEVLGVLPTSNYSDGPRQMRTLLDKYSDLDARGKKEFLKIQQKQISIREKMKDLVEAIEINIHVLSSNETLFDARITPKVENLLSYVSGVRDRESAIRRLVEFSKILCRVQDMKNNLRKALDTQVGFHQRRECARLIYAQLEEPQLKELVKNVVEQSLYAMTDVVGINILSEMLSSTVGEGDPAWNEVIHVGLLQLLTDLANTVPHEFSKDALLQLIVAFSSRTDHENIEGHLNLLTRLSIPLKTHRCVIPAFFMRIFKDMKQLIVDGTPSQSKAILRFIYFTISDEAQRKVVFNEVWTLLEDPSKSRLDLNPAQPFYITTLTAIRQIAVLMCSDYEMAVRPVMEKVLLILKQAQDQAEIGTASPNDSSSNHDIQKEHHQFVSAMKTVTSWLIGRSKLGMAADEIKEILSLFLFFLDFPNLPSGARNHQWEPWIRLSAARCILRACTESKIYDQLTPRQFAKLSLLLIDQLSEIRLQFGTSLHKGFARGLPMDFMGYYALVSYETNPQIKRLLSLYMLEDAENWRQKEEQLSSLMFAYMFPVMVNNPRLNDESGSAQFIQLKQCILYFLSNLGTRPGSCLLPHYLGMVGRIQRCELVSDEKDEDFRRHRARRRLHLMGLAAEQVIEQLCPMAKHNSFGQYSEDFQKTLPSKFFQTEKLENTYNCDQHQDQAKVGLVVRNSNVINVEPLSAKETTFRIHGMYEDMELTFGIQISTSKPNLPGTSGTIGKASGKSLKSGTTTSGSIAVEDGEDIEEMDASALVSSSSTMTAVNLNQIFIGSVTNRTLSTQCLEDVEGEAEGGDEGQSGGIKRSVRISRPPLKYMDEIPTPKLKRNAKKSPQIDKGSKSSKGKEVRFSYPLVTKMRSANGAKTKAAKASPGTSGWASTSKGGMQTRSKSRELLTAVEVVEKEELRSFDTGRLNFPSTTRRGARGKSVPLPEKGVLRRGRSRGLDVDGSNNSAPAANKNRNDNRRHVGGLDGSNNSAPAGDRNRNDDRRHVGGTTKSGQLKALSLDNEIVAHQIRRRRSRNLESAEDQNPSKHARR